VAAPACEGAHEATLADFDADGDLDLATACWGGEVVAILANDGLGAFRPAATPKVGWAGHSVVPFDADGDGDLDLAVAARASNEVSIVRNDGGLTFTTLDPAPVGEAPHSVRAGDLDDDGDTDLVSANDSADSISVLLGDGTGAFTRRDVPTGGQPKSVAVADLDGDGIPDVITANLEGNYPDEQDPDITDLRVHLGVGDGTFREPIAVPDAGMPFAVIAADLDADGLLDLASANWTTGSAAVLLRER
jgi:hypothetical protein